MSDVVNAALKASAALGELTDALKKEDDLVGMDRAIDLRSAVLDVAEEWQQKRSEKLKKEENKA